MYNTTGCGTDGSFYSTTLDTMELSSADTRQLEAAMVAGVRMVRLGEDLGLDMETLAQYDGRGQCAS